GSNKEPIYDARALAVAASADVVVPNYRLNFFGLGFANISEIPGNVGWQDIAMVLDWVVENINYLKGEKDFTVWGVGAGAAAAGLLLFSNFTTHGFERVIFQGGSPFRVNPNIYSGLKELFYMSREVCRDNATIPCLKR